MWICKQCNEENEDNFDGCWKCGTKVDGTPPENPEQFKRQKNEEEESDSENYNTEYESTFDTTRVIAQIVSIIGWITVIIGGIIFFVTIVKAARSQYGFEWLGLLPAFSGFISGLFLVMSGQITRAIVDNTDNTGEILSLLREIANKE